MQIRSAVASQSERAPPTHRIEVERNVNRRWTEAAVLIKAISYLRHDISHGQMLLKRTAKKHTDAPFWISTMAAVLAAYL